MSNIRWGNICRDGKVRFRFFLFSWRDLPWCFLQMYYFLSNHHLHDILIIFSLLHRTAKYF